MQEDEENMMALNPFARKSPPKDEPKAPEQQEEVEESSAVEMPAPESQVIADQHAPHDGREMEEEPVQPSGAGHASESHTNTQPEPTAAEGLPQNQHPEETAANFQPPPREQPFTAPEPRLPTREEYEDTPYGESVAENRPPPMPETRQGEQQISNDPPEAEAEQPAAPRELSTLEFADSIESVLSDTRGMTSLHPERTHKTELPSEEAEPAADTEPSPSTTPAVDVPELPVQAETQESSAIAEPPTVENHREAPTDGAGSTATVPTAPVDSSEDETKARKRPMRIGEKLIAHGLISEDQLQVALQEQKTRKKLLGAILVDMGFITESTLGEVLAESTGSKKFDPKSTMLDPELTRKIPKQVATRNKVIPVSMSEHVLTVATPDVYNVLAIDQIKRHFDRNIKIETIYCSESEVLELIEKYYEYELSIDGILQEIETGIREKGEIDSNEDGYTNPTVRLVNAILVDAIHRGASDIHFEPEGQFLRLRYRIDGDLEQIRSFHRDYWQAIAVRIKIISGMNIAESRMPQDGRINFEIMGREVDFRVATQPTVYGENIVMRLLDKTKSLVPLSELGFAEHSVTLLKRLLKRPEGIIIVTGPTGSGKTTTLYSILNYINSIDVNIMTLEDPVEYQLSLIRQSNVQEGTVDFANGIKSLMRQDPDVIFIGEVRDEKTALMTIRAALTGHQVFTTLHTNDALGAIPRLSDIGVPGHLLAGSLIATMAQRLARKLCSKCKKPRLARPEESRMLGYMPDQPPTIYEAVGCPACGNKGYKGRTAVLEILNVDDGMAELIATNATRNMMLEYALENGFITMMDDGIDKVIKGEIDLVQLIETVDMTERL